jgi:hypothetical protein
MFLDGHLSAAFDRRPVSFLPMGCNLICNSSEPGHCTFLDDMHALNALKLDWQTTTSRDKQSSIGADMLLAALSNVDQAAEGGFRESGLSIQGRLNQLVYTIHASSFRAHLIRHNCLSSAPSTDRRAKHLTSIKQELKKIVEAFIALKHLSPLALIAWDILHASLSSALLLAAIDKVFSTTDSADTIERLIRTLPSCTGKLTGADGETMNMAYVLPSIKRPREPPADLVSSVAPFYHALDALKHGFK